MTVRRPLIATLASGLTIALAWMVIVADATSPVQDSVVTSTEESLTKLRKVHLVRPDLIHYPLVTDFIC